MGGFMDSTLVFLAEKAVGGVKYLTTVVKDLSPHIWEMAKQKVYAESICSLVIGSIILILSLVAFTIACKTFKKLLKDGTLNDLNDKLNICVAFSCLACLIIIVIDCITLTVCFIDPIKHLVAVDYYALKNIVDLVKGITP